MKTEGEGTSIRCPLADRRISEAVDPMRSILNRQLAESMDLAKSLIQQGYFPG